MLAKKISALQIAMAYLCAALPETSLRDRHGLFSTTTADVFELFRLR